MNSSSALLCALDTCSRTKIVNAVSHFSKKVPIDIDPANQERRNDAISKSDVGSCLRTTKGVFWRQTSEPT